MVRAILDGRKTQTRRVVKVCPKDDRGFFSAGRPIIPDHYGPREGVNLIGAASTIYLLDGMGLTWQPYGGSPDVPWPAERIGEASPFGAPGDRLWVKETFVVETNRGWGCSVEYPPPFNDGRPIDWHDEPDWGKWWRQAHYRATEPTHDLCDPDEEDEKNLGWRPSIFMPRWASRIDLEITRVRVERLQDLSGDDARAEGIPTTTAEHTFVKCFRDPAERAAERVKRYAAMWDGINGARASWNSNPWVWVVSFKRVRP